jgi:ankyrin repeat protein
MEKLITILLTIIYTNICAFGQDNNEKLYKAIVNGDSTLVKQLLNDKADPNFIKAEGPWMKVNMLITAVNSGNIEIVKILIANKADITWRDGFNTTAIMYAASKGNKEIVTLLLDNGADINDNDGQGNTVLSAAKESKNKELVKFIKEKLKEKK